MVVYNVLHYRAFYGALQIEGSLKSLNIEYSGDRHFSFGNKSEYKKAKGFLCSKMKLFKSLLHVLIVVHHAKKINMMYELFFNKFRNLFGLYSICDCNPQKWTYLMLSGIYAYTNIT